MEDGRPARRVLAIARRGGTPVLHHILCLILQALPRSGLSGIVYND